MTKEQHEFICKCQRDMVVNTNMTPDEAWEFGCRCWDEGLAKPQTNADYIRSLSDGELAHFLMDFKDNFDGVVYDWLKGVRW